MREKAEVEYKVEGDAIEFQRSGAKGKIVVTDDSVRAEVTLGLLLKPMRSFVEQKVDEYFARYFR